MEDFVKVEISNYFFKGLLIRVRRIVVDSNIVGGMRENFVFVVEGVLFVVDGYGGIWRYVYVGEFGNVVDFFYVGGVVVGVEDVVDFYFGVGVSGGN